MEAGAEPGGPPPHPRAHGFYLLQPGVFEDVSLGWALQLSGSA